MSKAFECDRCHKCFSPKSLKKADEFFVTLKFFYDQNYDAYENQKYRSRYEDLHLCPDCSRKFYAFMNDV